MKTNIKTTNQGCRGNQEKYSKAVTVAAAMILFSFALLTGILYCLHTL